MNLKSLPGFQLVFLTVFSSVSFIMVAPTLYAEKQAYKLTTLAEGLDFPWSIDFLPDGEIIVAELGGALALLSQDSGERIEVQGTPSVYRAGQGGLFDVLLSPDFTVSNQVFLSYAAGNEKSNRTTVARGNLKNNEITDLRIIYEANTSKYAALHYGGRLAWTSEGSLLLVTGDGFDF